MLFIATCYLLVILPLLVTIIKRQPQNFRLLFKLYLNCALTLGIAVVAIKLLFGNWLSLKDGLFQPAFTFKFVVLVTLIQLGLIGIDWFLKRFIQIDLEFVDYPGRPYGSLVSAFLLALAYFFLVASNWANQNFGLLTPEQIVYNLRQPMEGVDSNFISSFIMGPLLGSLVLLVVLAVALVYLRRFAITCQLKKPLFKKQLIGRYVILPSVLIFVILTTIAAVKINAVGFYQYFTSDSAFIENNYAKPTEDKLTFPKQKRNLIYIYAESLESTATSKALGGQMDENLLPELTALAEEEGIHFSNTDKEFGGAQQLPGTGWTIAGMVAQTAGMPLKEPVDGNDYGTGEGAQFLPGMTTLTDILADQGYNQVALFGSDATFGGRRTLFTQHGNVKIDDLLTARKTGRVSKDYKVWWGYEDSKLFEYAKEDATKLSQSNKPFNLTMLTANTHHIGGYVEKDMPNQYSNQYSNVIAFSDHQIVEFIKWAKTQSFYKNTTIIVDGDHLGMDVNYYKKIPESGRHTFNLVLNAPKTTTTVKTKNRQFSTMDMFPTTLAAMGVKIKGNQLGLGTNLLSNQKTLIEKKGLKKVTNELSENSKFYNNTFVFDKK